MHEFLCLALTQGLDMANTPCESEPADEVCGVPRHEHILWLESPLEEGFQNDPQFAPLAYWLTTLTEE